MTILAKHFILERPKGIFQLVWTCNLIGNPLKFGRNQKII